MSLPFLSDLRKYFVSVNEQEKKKSYFQIFNTHLGVTINLFLLAGEVFKYSLTQQLFKYL